MKSIQSTQLGKLEYLEENVITFDLGIPGFDEEKQFIICQNDNESPFAYLQSIDNKDLTFILANPFIFFTDYEYKLDNNIIEELKIKRIEDVATWGIVSISEDIRKTSINLKAPIIINIITKKGRQHIIQETDYLTRTPLFSQAVKEGGK